MIKTNEKYADGRIVYLHDCPICGTPNSARNLPSLVPPSHVRGGVLPSTSEIASEQKSRKSESLV